MFLPSWYLGSEKGENFTGSSDYIQTLGCEAVVLSVKLG